MIQERRFDELFAVATDAAKMGARFCAEFTRRGMDSFDFDTLEVPRVFPQSDGEFIIQYRLSKGANDSSNNRSQIFWGRLFPGAECSRNYAAGNPEQIIVLEDIQLSIPIFPFDPALSIMRTITTHNDWNDSPWNRLSELDVFRQRPELLAVDLLAYRLERRAVFKLTLAGAGERARTVPVICKVMSPRKAERFKKLRGVLTSAISGPTESSGLKMPIVHGIDVIDGLVIMEFVSGHSLHDLIGDRPDFVDGCSAAGRLLSALHDVTVPDLPRHTTATELEKLRELAGAVGLVRPQRYSDFSRAIDIAEAKVADMAEAEPVCLHTDFYDKQVLWGSDKATLIDFENPARGDAAKDIGNFLAHLDLRALQEPEATIGRDIGTGAFLSHYERKSVSPINIQWWRETTSIRLAMLYTLRPRWRNVADKLIRTTQSKQVGRG